jgi:DNA-binding XRE family transcriptional regulator
MSAKLNPVVHNNIKSLRAKTGRVQKEVAHDLGVKLDRYRSWEQQKRNPTGAMAAKIADYFGVTMDDVLGSKQASSLPPKSNTQSVTDEQRLLDAYRQLGDADKATVTRVVYALLDTAEYGDM